MKKLIFTGAQGTGKTTILNKFRGREDYKIITEVVRTLNKTKGIKINELGDEEGQRMIYDTYYDLLSCDQTFVSDRGLTDVLAYSMYLANHFDKDKDYKQWARMAVLADEQIYDLDEFAKKHNDILYCYFPIEFPVKDDGVRSTDETFRAEINKTILKILDTLELPYITVTGTPEERYKQILQAAES